MDCPHQTLFFRAPVPTLERRTAKLKFILVLPGHPFEDIQERSNALLRTDSAQLTKSRWTSRLVPVAMFSTEPQSVARKVNLLRRHTVFDNCVSHPFTDRHNASA